MKTLLKTIGTIAMAAIIGFTMAGCPDDGNTGGGGGGGGKPTSVPGKDLAEKLAWLKENAADGKEYSVTVGENEEIAPTELDYSGKKVKINISGGSVTLTSNGYMFRLRTGVTLTLRNITLNGKESNNNSLIRVSGGGTLVMENGSKITGNVYTGTANGGGVDLESGAVGGTFIMNGGEISGNTAGSSGGGVFVSYGGIFTMNNGKISGNTANGGGGLYITGTCTMNGGEISGNTATSSGGGVRLYSNYPSNPPTFYITNGTIYGSSEADNVKNTASSGAALEISATGGGTVQYGTVKNGIWTKAENGDLATTNDTIKVENGAKK